MSETDSFIQEVTEEVRRDRLFRLARRYGWIAVLAIVAIVGGAGFVEWRKAREAAAAQAFGDALYAALERETSTGRATALAEIDAEGEAAALRDFMRAAELSQGDAQTAGDLLADIAAREGIRPVFRDLATLRLTMIADYPLFSDERLNRLRPLTLPGAPLRLLAMEQMAYIHADRDEPAEAVALLRQVAEDAEASPGQVRRASDLIVALGGNPDARDGDGDAG